MTDETVPKHHKIYIKIGKWVGILVFVSALGILGTVLFVRQRPEILGLSKADVGTQAEVDAIVAQVKKLIALPDEAPTLATVTDTEKLRDQPFFASAQNGDKVLIFTNAKKAILYRPSTHLIIDVAPINIGDSSPSGQAAGIQTQPVTVVLRNGTDTVGLTGRFEAVLKQKAPTITVVDRENAKSRNYAKSIIVDIKGTKSAEAQTLAETLGMTIASLPEDEATPSSDFLIILGLDQQ